jgi:heterodisulfide reductase subunit C
LAAHAVHAQEEKKLSFMEEVIASTPSEARLKICIQCGTCGGSCPSSSEMDYTPRGIFALMAAGEREKVLKSNTFWYCVSCYYCMVRCPQEIHITDIMYTLKRMSIREGYSRESSGKDAPGFSKTFIYYVENYGRSFELGLASVYHLTHHPLSTPKMVPFALGMFTKGRMDLTPRRIKNLDKFKAILNKAKEMSKESGGLI